MGAVVSGPWPAQRACLLCFFLVSLGALAISSSKPGPTDIDGPKKGP